MGKVHRPHEFGVKVGGDDAPLLQGRPVHRPCEGPAGRPLRRPHAGGGDREIFARGRGELIKVLWHDGDGTSLYARRLERGQRANPRPPGRSRFARHRKADRN